MARKYDETTQQYVQCSFAEYLEPMMEQFEAAYVWHYVPAPGGGKLINEFMTTKWEDVKAYLDKFEDTNDNYISIIAWTQTHIVLQYDCEGNEGYTLVPRHPEPSRFSLVF